METSKRARRRKSDTAKADLKPPLAVSGGQGVHREMESEGHEEKFRAVIKGSPSDEPVGQRWVRSSPHHEGEGVLIHPPYQGDCGRHGTEEQRVTSGGLTESLGGTRVSGPISASEGASDDALPVDGRLCSTTTPVKAVGPSNRRSEVDRGRQPAKTVGKRQEAR